MRFSIHFLFCVVLDKLDIGDLGQSKFMQSSVIIHRSSLSIIQSLPSIISLFPPSPDLEARKQQERYWGGCTLKSCAIDQVSDAKSFYHFFETTLLPRLFSDRPQYYELTAVDPDKQQVRPIYTLNDKSVPWKPRYDYEYV